MKIIFLIGLLVLGLAPQGRAASAAMSACRAAYEAKDPWKVFETCGQLIADGDLPEDANVWDWLALASENVNNELDNWDTVKAYWKRSEDSGQKTGRMAFNAYDGLRGEEARNEAFKKIGAYGPWMMARAHAYRAHTYRRGNNLKQAIADMTSAIKLVPHYKNYFDRSEWYEAQRKYPAQNKDLIAAVKLAESVGVVSSNAHTKLKYDDPAAFDALFKDLDPVSRYKRGKFLKKETASAVDWCMYSFVGSYETALGACEEAARSTPNDPRGHNYLAATLLKQPNPDFARADAALAAALKADPKFARAHINRGASLRLQGKFEEALKPIQEALALDPSLSVPAGFANLGFIHAGLGNFDEAAKNWDSLLAKNPWDDSAMRNKAIALTKAGRFTEALYTSAQLIAYKPLEKNYELRGDIQAAAGNDLLAAQNYMIAMQMNDATFKKLYPKWSAARETFLAKQGDVKPTNLLDVLRELPTYVREKGNLEPKFVSSGLRTQWQSDGSLRFWTQGDEGFYLLSDGVKFQKALSNGGRGPVESPQETSSGKRIYPVGEFRLAWIPNDSFYFGLLKPIAQSENGRHVFVNGMEYAGPFIAGQSVRALREVSRRTEGEKTIITFTDGLVEITEPGRQSTLDIPGAATFRGDISASHLPYTGVLTSADNSTWSVVYQGKIWKTGPKGIELYADPSRDGWITLSPSGDLTDNNHDAWNKSTTVYPASGEAPSNRTEANKAPDWREFEKANAERAKQEELDEALRRARSYVPETTRRACYRCSGSGQVWQSGGASQSRVSAPSGSSASQREDFYNSASSIRTTYSSGGMNACPICNGQGSY